MNALLQRVHRIDTLAFTWLHVTKQFPYRRSARFISRLGDGPLYTAIALALVAWKVAGATSFLFMGLIAFAMDISLYLFLKNLIKRDRPAVNIDLFESSITPSDQFSFPSGHTAAAFVFAYMVWNFYPTFAAPAYILACLIGASRVLLGVHYPSDILAGAVLGSGCAIAGSAIYTLAVGLW